MISTVVKVADDGTIKIPPEIWQEAGITPPEEVKIEVGAKQITLLPRREPVPLSDADRKNLKRIGELIKETFAGMNWEDAHRARRDR